MSLILYLLFESPFANFEKILFKTNQRKTPNKYLKESKTNPRFETNNNETNNRISLTNMSHVLHITKM